MSAPATDATCPTTPGLSSEGGFDPGLDWSSVKANPTANWHVIGWMICLLLLAITWIVSIVTVTKHLRNYYEPQIQRHKLRVLLFPPVYATLAWFSYLRYDYATTIMFFATMFEAFAVFNLYTSLQAYLEPFRQEAGNLKEEKDTKIMFVKNLHLKSMWGMHYRTITDMLVFQYPVWSLVDSFMSIFAQLKGRYCEGVYSFKGAYVYLTIINFFSLSVILTALFTYLDVYHREWKRGNVPAHGMFWCVKGPIMFIFYVGEMLLTILTTAGVINGTDGTHGSIAWPADAVKNGLYVIIICVVMFVDCFMMLRFFGPKDNIQNAAKNGQIKKMGYWHAFYDGYVSYIPEFFYLVACCGADSFKLMKKRKALKKRQNLEALNGTNNNLSNSSNPTDHLLDNSQNNVTVQNDHSEYKMENLGSSNTTTANAYQPPMAQYHANHSDDSTNSYQTPLQMPDANAYQQNVYPQSSYTSTQPQPVHHQQSVFPQPHDQQSPYHPERQNTYSQQPF
ncbi:unnamed protein product [Mucor circinelloides]|uniref:DUF300-domain-containing protein n=1 Tax=Mucor circinelloides f. circinelloides (strain 1006PhL) TaxID=1220926 RepID=S2JDV6_MUCC1|nr:hypothetical protein HMPREF1544_04792 [Mucor circinelloides 1006PhL]